jgi:hypothetical protein
MKRILVTTLILTALVYPINLSASVGWFLFGAAVGSSNSNPKKTTITKGRVNQSSLFLLVSDNEDCRAPYRKEVKKSNDRKVAVRVTEITSFIEDKRGCVIIETYNGSVGVRMKFDQFLKEYNAIKDLPLK